MKQNRCPDLRDLFAAFVEGRFDTTESLLKAHVDQCLACRQALQEQLHTWTTLDNVAKVVVSPHFQTKLNQRLQTVMQKTYQQEQWWQKIDLLFHWLRFPVLAGLVATALFLKPMAPGTLQARQQLQTQTGQKIQRLVNTKVPDSVFVLAEIYKKHYLKRRTI